MNLVWTPLLLLFHIITNN